MTTAPNKIFESGVRAAGDLAGVFEHDGEAGFFYLYRMGDENDRVLGAIHILTGRPDFSAEDLEIRWTADDVKVGLFIRGELWAVFDSDQGTKYGDNYRPRAHPELPAVARRGFERPS